MTFDVEHLLRTANMLETAINRVPAVKSDGDTMYDLYRDAAIKSFELSMQVGGKLLREALKLSGGNPLEIDRCAFEDVLRRASKQGLLDQAVAERWLAYRANLSAPASDGGAKFADQTQKMLPTYLQDLRQLAANLQKVLVA
jgi:hypothetical protein